MPKLKKEIIIDDILRVGVDVSSRTSHSGPKVFMGRLCSGIEKSGEAVVVPYTDRFYDIGLFANQPKNKFGKPYVIRLDGIYFDKNNTRGDNNVLNAPVIDAVDKSVGVMFQSEYCRDLYQKQIGNPECVVSICGNAINTEIFHSRGVSRRTELGFKADDHVIVMSGHWRAHKRLRDGVELFRRMRNGSEGSFKLLVIGRRPDYVVDDPDILYLGEIEPSQLAPYYRAGDVFLTTSWLEPAGNVHIEAMACGLPVVCMNNGGAHESVRASNGGIVVPADPVWDLITPLSVYDPPSPDYDLVIDALLTILKDLDHYRERINTRPISIEAAVEKYLDLLRLCLVP